MKIAEKCGEIIRQKREVDYAHDADYHEALFELRKVLDDLGIYMPSPKRPEYLLRHKFDD